MITKRPAAPDFQFPLKAGAANSPDPCPVTRFAIQEAAENRPMCDEEERFSSTLPGSSAELGQKRRIRLWELPGNLQCSVVGTCLSQQDLMALARKLACRIGPDARDYDVHSFFVKLASKPGRPSKLMHKLLEARFSTIVSKVGTVKEEKDLIVLWEEEVEAGRIPGAYWAFLSHSHVPQSLFTRIFGEVHMQSHLLGKNRRASIAQEGRNAEHVAELEAQLARLTERNTALVAERNTLRLDLEKAKSEQLAARKTQEQITGQRTDDVKSKGIDRNSRMHRALVSAREKARAAERQIETMQIEIERLRATRSTTIRNDRCVGAEACETAVAEGISRRILYIGGRIGNVEHLRQAAGRQGAELLHHDGGQHEVVSRIDGLVEGCDAVFCPIDCVSHSACLRAKALCRRFGKPFVPLRSAGATSFERALHSLAARR